MATRDVVFPASLHALYERHRYSPAVRAGDLLFVSGQVGARADGTPEPDLEAQVRLAFDNLDGVLSAAGVSFDDVVDVTVLMVDPDAIFERVFAVLGDYWEQKPYPNITAAGVTWLSGFQFEIKVVAHLRGSSDG